MQVRLGAPAEKHGDAELITELMAPPTGNVTVQRNGLLQLLADRAGLEHAVFNKKLVAIDQSEEASVLKFADGTEETASAVVGCDGIHSAVRRAMLGPEHAATAPRYSGMGAYRAILATEDLEQAIGVEMARTSQVFLGPDAYIIMYPVDRGRKVNVGFWPWRREPWPDPEDWVLPAQREAMEKQFTDWGETVHNIMGLVGNPPFFATHHHGVQPDSHFQGRVCLIGDAAHSMPPHQGAGAGQAMEDAYVMAEVLRCIDPQQRSTQQQVEAAFRGYEAVRKPRSQRVLETSQEAMSFWADLYKETLTDERLRQFVDEANERFHWIWHDDIAAQARSAVDEMRAALKS